MSSEYQPNNPLDYAHLPHKQAAHHSALPGIHRYPLKEQQITLRHNPVICNASLLFLNLKQLC